MSEPGTLGERYALGEVLGSGGAAQVHRATDTLLGVDRAIKVLLDSGPHIDLLRSRLRNEARIMAQLQHPNVLRVYDIGVHEGRDYIVMDLAEGGSLSEWLDREGPMHPAVAVHYTLQVLSALDAAHQAGVVHRDVKPQNVLLDSHGGALLADFGIALLSEDALRTTRTNMAMGSMCFMAPEQRMDAKNVGPEADLYAVACSLYNLLTDGNPIDLFTAKRLSGRWDEVAEPLRPILWRATRHDPDERYQDAASMAADLARVLPSLGELPSAPRPQSSLVPAPSLPLPTPEATASAISRIAESRVRRVTGVTPSGPSPTDPSPAYSPTDPSPTLAASATFLPMDLESEPGLEEAGSFLERPEAQGNPTLVPNLDEALAKLNAAVPEDATLLPPPPPQVPALSPSPEAPAAPTEAAPPPDRRALWALVALVIALLLWIAWPQLMGEDPVAEDPITSASSTGNGAAAGAAPGEVDGAGGGSVEPPEGAPSETPGVEESSEAETQAEGTQEAGTQEAEAPDAGRPGSEASAEETSPPASGSASQEAEAGAPQGDPPAAEAAANATAVAGTWSITSTSVAFNTRLRLSGSDDAVRGNIVLPSGQEGPRVSGTYNPNTGALTMNTSDGSPYLQANYPGEGRTMQGEVFGPRGKGSATLAKK